MPVNIHQVSTASFHTINTKHKRKIYLSTIHFKNNFVIVAIVHGVQIQKKRNLITEINSN